MTETNGHAPAVNLADVMARTAPARTVILPRHVLDVRNVTLWELAVIGRALGVSPLDIGRMDAATWDGIELQQAIAWVILRREEPDLSWADAQRFALEVEPEPDPTLPVKPGASGRNGTPGRSKSTVAPGSGPKRRGV